MAKVPTVGPSAVANAGKLKETPLKEARRAMNRAIRALLEQIKTVRRAWPAIIGLLLSFQSMGALAEGPGLGFVDGSATTLSPDRSGKFSFDLAIKNSGADKGRSSLTFLSKGSDKCGRIEATFDPDENVLPNAIAIARIAVLDASLPATCYLTLTDDKQRNTSVKQLKLAQHYVTSVMSFALYACIALSAFVSSATFVAAGRWLDGVSARYKLGSPAWDFAKSWISTTTLASAVITTALTLSALPDLTRYANKSGYAALAMLISLVVVVAPFVFVAFRTGTVEKDPANGQEIVLYQGSLWLFLVSGAMTLFAGLAQAVILFFLLDEIFLQGAYSPNRLPWLASIVGSISAVALVGALCWYVGQSMFLTIKLQHEADKRAVSSVPLSREKDFLGKADDRPLPAKNPPRDWSVL